MFIKFCSLNLIGTFLSDVFASENAMKLMVYMFVFGFCMVTKGCSLKLQLAYRLFVKNALFVFNLFAICACSRKDSH